MGGDEPPGTLSGRPPARPAAGRDAGRAITIAAYVFLVLFGVAQAVVGAFFYAAGPAPLAAIGFDLAIIGSCLLGGWGLARPSGGLAPAAGWFVTAFLLANGTASGSVVITASTAGGVFLLGGAIGAAVAVVATFVFWSRRPSR